MIPISCQCRHTLKAPSRLTLSLHKVGPGELRMNLPRVQLWRRNHLQRSKWFLWQALNIFISVTLNTDSCWSRHQVDNGGTAFCCSTLPQVNLHNFCWTDGCSCKKKKKKNYNVSNNEASVCTITGKLRLQAALHPGSVWWEREKEKISLIRSSQAHKPYPICCSDLFLRRNSQPVGSK